jgi:hypothetical protein
MPKFNLAGLPRELRLKKSPIARAEGDAVYLWLDVFSVKDPTDTVEFEICLAAESAQQLAADLVDAAKRTI